MVLELDHWPKRLGPFSNQTQILKDLAVKKPNQTQLLKDLAHNSRKQLINLQLKII
jgi:hypothetical protein